MRKNCFSKKKSTPPPPPRNIIFFKLHFFFNVGNSMKHEEILKKKIKLYFVSYLQNS